MDSDDLGYELSPEEREEHQEDIIQRLKEAIDKTPQWQGIIISVVGEDEFIPGDESGVHTSVAAGFVGRVEALSHLINTLSTGGEDHIDAIFIGLMSCSEFRSHIAKRLHQSIQHPSMMPHLLAQVMQSLAEYKDSMEDKSEEEPTHTLEDIMGMFNKKEDENE